MVVAQARLCAERSLAPSLAAILLIAALKIYDSSIEHPAFL